LGAEAEAGDGEAKESGGGNVPVGGDTTHKSLQTVFTMTATDTSPPMALLG
jgi:hypothetical protein